MAPAAEAASEWISSALRQFDAYGLALLLERSPDAVVVLDHRARIRFANPAGQRLLNHPAGALVGLDALVMIHEDDRDLANRSFAAALATDDQVGPVVLRVPDASGAWLHLEVRAQNLLACPPIAGVMLNVRDVTDRVRAEDALQASERRFRELADSAPDFIFRCRTEPEIVFEYASPALQAITGYLPADLYANPTLLLDVLDADVIANLRAMAPDELLEPIEFNIHHRTGTDVWVQLRITLHRDDDGNVVLVDGILRDLTERKRAEDERLLQAMHDPLTGLPNRALFYDRLNLSLARADRLPHSPAVLLLDLDGFKDINDRFGHTAGDLALRIVAERLTAAVRPSDTVARLGGDEFLVLCDDIAGDSDLDGIRRRVREAVIEPIQIGEHTAVVDVSIGSTRAAEATDADALVRHADEAMYLDKEQGKNGARSSPAITSVPTPRGDDEASTRGSTGASSVPPRLEVP